MDLSPSPHSCLVKWMERVSVAIGLALITSSPGTLEMKCICQKEKIEIHSARRPDIAFIPFSQNKRRQPNQGSRRMQITALNFS